MEEETESQEEVLPYLRITENDPPGPCRRFRRGALFGCQRTIMDMNKTDYEAPLVRMVETRQELCFLQSGESGTIDPGMDDPWGDY